MIVCFLQESSRTPSTESETGSQTASAQETSPTKMTEIQPATTPRKCTRQATFPNAAPQGQVLAYPPRQMSLPACPDQESNIFGQKPLTTSQVCREKVCFYLFRPCAE